MSEGQPEEIFGSPKAGSGMWASCIRVLSPTEVGNRCLARGDAPPPYLIWSPGTVHQASLPFSLKLHV